MSKKVIMSVLAVGLVGVAGGTLYWNVFRPSVLIPKSNDAKVEVKQAAFDEENGVVNAILAFQSEDDYYASVPFVQLPGDYFLPVSIQNQEQVKGEIILPVIPGLEKNPYLVVDKGGKISSWIIGGYSEHSPKDPGIEAKVDTSNLKLSNVDIKSTITRFTNSISNPSCQMTINVTPKDTNSVATVDRVQIPVWHNAQGKMAYNFPDELNTSHQNGRVRFDNPAYFTTDLVPVRWKGTEAKIKEVAITDWTYKMETGRAIATCKVDGTTYTFGILGRGGMQGGPASGSLDKLFVLGEDSVYYFGRIKGQFNFGRVTHEQAYEMLKKVKAYQVTDINEYTCEGVVKAEVKVEDRSKAQPRQDPGQPSRQSL